ncbi:unnamed protein product [marine sediment metagenome]|uniref:Right handed beta helix domain-containing protein n=1 Tax=marine sediment metagenome TaxID=412755 RepID=X1C4B4_9ZZZZ
MKSNEKRKLIIVLTLLFVFTFSAISIGNLNFTAGFMRKNLKLSAVSDKIYISGDSGWSNAKDTGICTGEGTSSIPYVIEDLVIDGNGLGSCIWIENTDVYFKIENCTLYNSGGNWIDGGISLVNVDNGQITNNTARNNWRNGISLRYCENNNISGNIVSIHT